MAFPDPAGAIGGKANISPGTGKSALGPHVIAPIALPLRSRDRDPTR